MNRRNLLKSGAALAVMSGLNAGAQNKTGANEVINIALIGCGGRGLGAAANALSADANTRLVAIADVFPERLQTAVERLKNYGNRSDIAENRRFSGFDAYKEVMALSEVDLVILTTPPHFRPIHIQAAVEAGKHIFAEKPLAVDIIGLKKVMSAVRECETKGLTFLCGFCYRFDQKVKETVAKVHEGMIGEIMSIQSSYNTGDLWMHPRQESWGDMEWQMRNWLYFTWLSGDHIVEQAVHTIDKMGWIMKDVSPEYAYGMGGRQSRTDEAYGNIFDHFSVQYKFPKNFVANFTCRQQKGTDTAVEDIIIGTEGTADLMRNRILNKEGEIKWRFKGASVNMYDAEHVELMKGLRSGKVVNNGLVSCNSTAMAIMGRLTAYTGKKITWENLMGSNENLVPQKYDLKAALNVTPTAKPGITPFI